MMGLRQFALICLALSINGACLYDPGRGVPVAPAARCNVEWLFACFLATPQQSQQ